ncbi:putative diguanylate cyclase YegE [Variovorax sp. SRS16]|uniref:diguanylate cyclase domain-containing protein n=1 Tax=Variovorax sp. SRS16 TaxID=282217 RepID=UPI001317C219|nr:diguanylate cyclase [Variovorax sp. SRS16]VTU14279.1 putative diguanylate cyclase YegE [Variovorax sp. SRS16]
MRLTLRTKTALLTTFVVLLLVGATGVWQYRRLSDEYVALMRAQQDALTRIAAADLDYKLSMHLSVLGRAARQLDARSFADSSAQQRFFAGSGLRPMFDSAALVATDGEVVVNDPPIDRPLNLADRDYFRRARDTATPTISAPLLSRITRQPVILMTVPVKDDDGRVAGFLSAALSLDRANVLGELAHASVGQGGYYAIVTRGANPVFVMHPDPRMLLQPVALPSTHLGDDASRDLTTSAPIDSTDWELRVVVPAKTAYAPLREARRALELQMLWLGVGCGVLVWIGTAWLMRPLAILYAAIRELRRSPDSAVKLDVRANDERGDLAREFDALMSELRDKRTEIAAVTDASPLGLFRSDTEGRMVYVNDAYLDIQGLVRSEMAEGWLKLVPDAIRATVREDWMRIVRKAQPFQTTRWLRRRDGTEVLVSLSMRPIMTPAGVAGHVGTLSDITERTRADQALRTLTAIFEATTDYVVQLDAKGRLTYMNPAARRRTGIAPDTPIEHLVMEDFTPPESLVRMHDEIVPAARAHGVWVGESLTWDAEHRLFPVSHMVIAHRDRHGKVERFSAIMRDISAAKETERELLQSEARLRTVADALPMRVAYIDEDQRYRFVNLAYEAGFGLPRDAIQGRSVRELLGDAAYRTVEPHIRAVLSGQRVTFQSESAQADNDLCFEANYIPQLAAGGDAVDGFHAVIIDITERKREERRLVRLARIDPLTGLGNRAAFEERLVEAMDHSRLDGALLALMYLDIDHFKRINDSWGHPVGDALLRAFATRLVQAVRSGDFVARLGGDEFVVLMEALPRLEAAALVAEQILQAMRSLFMFGDRALQVSASIGVAFHRGEVTTADALVRRADEMLYRAKGAGRDNCQLAEVPGSPDI